MTGQAKTATVHVVQVVLHPDGSFMVRGTLDRTDVPVVLRAAADCIEQVEHT